MAGTNLHQCSGPSRLGEGAILRLGQGEPESSFVRQLFGFMARLLGNSSGSLLGPY